MTSVQELMCLTGATGYIGGRLLTRLEGGDRPLRCLTRRPDSLRDRVSPETEVCHGDVLDRDSLLAGLSGVHTTYYLVHNMGSGDDFEQRDRDGAANFASAAKQCGVKRIIYLGGLGDARQRLSSHLRSRQEVGEILRQGGVQVLEFRASIVIGSGSLSFELIRSLVERLPVMVCPRWVSTPAQPIAVEDVLAYLTEALDYPGAKSRVFEIGGPDQVSYGAIMREYARQRGLRRRLISVPVLTPYLSSLWLGLVTPVYARTGRKLIDGLRNPTVVRDGSARTEFSVRPRGLAQAIERALMTEDREFAASRWSDAVSSGGNPKQWGGTRFGSRIVDSRSVEVDVPVERAFDPIARIGGDTGWYYGNWLWKTRGFLDLMIGGVGVRRGRRHPTQLRPGDALDFWRVEQVAPPHRLRLAAEMKVPGRAWLEFDVEATKSGSRIHQTATFDPLGLAGLAYWYTLYPLHGLVFAGMLQGIAAEAQRDASTISR